MNSREAPPPVEMCVILSASPAFVTAAAESPPPIIVLQSVNSAKYSAIAFVPTANGFNSNTPTGPFHKTVFASARTLLYNSIDSGPISNPSQSSGISLLW